MAVPTDAVTEQVFVGAGTASALAPTFKFLDANDLVITAIVGGVEDPEPLVRGVDYSVAGGLGSTGTVTPLAAIPVGTSWRVRRETPLGQPATLPSGSFQPASIETAIDRQALGLQEQAREIARALMVARGETALPVGAIAEGQALGRLNGVLVGVPNSGAEAEAAANRAEDAQALAEAARDDANGAEAGASAHKIAAQAAQALAEAAAGIVSDLGNAPIYGALADLPTADGTQGWAIIPFGADAGIYEDTGSWTKQADTAAVQAQAQVALAADEADRAEAAADSVGTTINNFGDIARFTGMERRQFTLTTPVGRATMLETGAFAFTTVEGQARPHYEDGVLKGYYLNGVLADEIKSARFHDQIPDSGDNHFVTNSNTGTGAATAYAGEHSAPDRFGDTGGGILFTQGTRVANGQRRLNNLTMAGVAGDIIRIEAFTSIFATSGAATFRPIRTRQISGTVPQITIGLDFDASGVIDPDSLVLPASNVILRGGIIPCEETVTDGLPVWMVWLDIPLTATGTIGYALDEASAIVGSQIMLHEARLLKNPKGPPNPLPMCADAPSVAADVQAIGAAAEAFDIEYRRLARTHSRQAGNSLQVPAVDQGSNRYAASGPVWPYEDEIVIRPSAVATGFAGILPSRNADMDFPQLQLRKSWNLRAKYYFAERIGTESSGDAGNIDLRGVAENDYFMLPWVTLTTSQLELEDLRLDAVIYAASSEFTAQREQVEVGENTVTDIQISGNYTSQILGFASHPLSHSRARRFSFPRVRADGENPHYIGTIAIKPDEACTMTINNVVGHGFGRFWQLVANGGTVPCTLLWDNWELTNFTSDGIFLGRGAVQAGSVIENMVIRDSGYLRENYYQTAPDMPIWIDTGAGFESIEDYATAQSMTVAEAVDTLPIGRRFQYYGYIDTPYTGSPDRTLADLVIDPSPVTYIPFSAASAGNTGAGTISGLTAAAPLAEGRYRLTIIAAATDAGTFQVVGPNNYYATGTVGAAFSFAGLAFTLGDGATDFVVGDSFTIWVKRFDFDTCFIEVTRYTVRATITATIAADAPGYQFHATNRQFSDGYNDNILPHDSAWVSTGGKPASASNPHLLIVRGDGERLAATGVWTAGTHPDAQPVLNNAGMHADPIQIDRTNITFEDTTFRNLAVRSRGQGALYAPGNETDMFTGLTVENVFAAITGGNAILLGPGTVSAEVDKVFVAPLWTNQCNSAGNKNQPGLRFQAGTTTLTNAFVGIRALSDSTEISDGITVDAGASVTGTPGIIRAAQNAYNFVEPLTPVRTGAEVTKPTLTSMVKNPDMIENGYFSAKSDLSTWEMSEFGIRHLGFDPLLGARNVYAADLNRKAFHTFCHEVLNQHPIAHGDMLNTAEVGDEIVLYDEDGAIVRLPGHTIDFGWGDGYGKDGPWRISEEGRVYLRWSLAGRDIFRRILTRRPDGEYGPIFTIDVKVA